MTTIVIDGEYLGRPKRTLIEAALAKCGLSSAEFDLDAEEVLLALVALNSLMAALAADLLLLGYNFPDVGNGNAAELSGIASADEEAVIGQLALRVAPQIGKTIAPEVRGDIDRAYRSLLNRYATIPAMVSAPHTPRGTGNRRRSLFINEA